MTLQEYQTYLHSLYQADGSTPSSSSDEWAHRKNLLHSAIGIWDSENALWNELWTTLADASDGSKTITAATVDYDMPTDFRFLGSFVRTTSAGGDHTYWQVISPQKAELYKNTSPKACYVTGNKSAGFDIHFTKQPTVGETINYPYYKEPSNPSATTDVIEMSDPWFAIYYALGKLHEQDGDGDRASAAYAVADQKLRNMKVRNAMLPHNQPNTIGDRDFDFGYSGFGNTGSWGISRYGDTL